MSGVGTSDPVLSIAGLGLRTEGRQPRPLLQDVGFEVRASETLCVVGESGSGKSITSLAVMGLLPPGIARPTGRIRLDGEELVGAPTRRLRQLRASRMAMVFQEPMTALNPVYTVGQQIDEVLRQHTSLGLVERRHRTLEILEAVRMPDVRAIARAYPHQLSGGQRQRVVISMALVLQPKLLIADEPTTALDVTTQKRILELIRDLQKQFNTAVLFITHDFGVVAEIADRIAVMNAGRLVELADRDTILRRPAQDYTRMLVSSVPSLVPRPRAAPAGESVLNVERLSKTYGSRTGLLRRGRAVAAAQDVSFTVRAGEITGIVGESGSGKSTVARCIVRLIDPSGGAVRIAGREIADSSRGALRPFRSRFQIIFQDPYRSLNPRLRISESLIEGLLNFGTPRAQALQKVTRLLELVGIPPDGMDRYPHQFSGGQRQRICIARALALGPRLLVADEAVSALDVSVQAQILKLLEELRTITGVGILFITHDLRVAAQICDSVIVMQHGRIVESGTVTDVLTRPKHDYTQALIDSAPGRFWDFQNFRPLEAAARPGLAT
jgi:peptide/nickel transport system ATP-binding protein